MSIEKKYVQAEMNAQLYCAFKTTLTLVAHIHIHDVYSVYAFSS